MDNKRMLILPADLVETINQNRGDLTQAEFINLLIDSHLEERPNAIQYATRDELFELEQDIKNLIRSFLDFSVTYGLELGVDAGNDEHDSRLSSKLQELHATIDASRRGHEDK